MPFQTLLSTQLKVSTHTVLVTGLLRLPAHALDQLVAEALAENPALERTEPDDGLPVPAFTGGSSRISGRENPQSGDAPAADPWEQIPAPTPVRTEIAAQARLAVPPADLPLVLYLVDCLDDHGFLREPPAELAATFAVPQHRVTRALTLLQQLDPPGIGARDAHECLALQCARLSAQGVDCRAPAAILEHAWDDFLHQRWREVSRAAGLSLQEVHTAVRWMRAHLCLFPVTLGDDRPDVHYACTQPDLIILPQPGAGPPRFRALVPPGPERGLRMAQAWAGGEEPDQPWVRQAVEQARTFLDALQQRRRLLLRIGDFLAEQQAPYFAGGPRDLKPITRAAAALALGVHESTVSRAAGDKILQRPDGRVVPLADLFDPTLAAKEAVAAILATGESLSDREIMLRLAEESFALSRRTVAKYRQELSIGGQALRARRKFIEQQYT